MPVTQQTPFNSFTAAAGATVFSSSFRVIQASDLVVRVNGVVRATGFIISGLGAAGGVDVTFGTPMVGGEKVELLREVPLTRATDYQQLGDFLSPMVNLDFDRIWHALQTQGARQGGAVRAPFPEQINELPAAAARAGRFLRFNDAGNPIASTIGSIGGTVTDASLVEYLPAGSGAVARTVQGKLRESVSLADFGATSFHTVRIPTDYPTLQAAFDALAPGTFTSGQFIDVRIDAGHQLTHGLSLTFGDYSHFRISSVDATVTLAPGFVFVTSANSVLSFDQCRAPEVNIFVDAGGLGGDIYRYQSSVGKISQQKGAINGNTNLYINSGSIVNAFRTIWNGGSNLCCWVSRTSLLDAEESSFNNGGNVGITIRRGSRANITNSSVSGNASNGVACTRSYVNFQGREDAAGPLLAYCNNNGSEGVVVTRGSQATLTGLQANNNVNSGVLVSSGSIADFDGGQAQGNGVAGVRAIQGGVVSAVGATISGNNRNIIATGAASSVDAQNAVLTGSVSAIVQALDCARVSVDGSTGNNAGTIAIEARDGASVSASDATFDNAASQGILCVNATVSAPRANIRGAGTEGVRVISGTVYFQSGNAQRTPGTDTTADINITNGAIIHANGAIGGYAATIVPNTISGNRGILFGA